MNNDKAEIVSRIMSIRNGMTSDADAEALTRDALDARQSSPVSATADMAAACAKFVVWALMEGSWQGADVDGCAAQDKAKELGLIVETTYDPNRHGTSDIAEIGDPWFVLSDPVRALIRGHAPRPEVTDEMVIPGSEDMDKRFAWLEAKAIDMGYMLVPEPDHPDSPHQPVPSPTCLGGIDPGFDACPKCGATMDDGCALAKSPDTSTDGKKATIEELDRLQFGHVLHKRPVSPPEGKS